MEGHGIRGLLEDHNESDLGLLTEDGVFSLNFDYDPIGFLMITVVSLSTGCRNSAVSRGNILHFVFVYLFFGMKDE